MSTQTTKEAASYDALLGAAHRFAGLLHALPAEIAARPVPTTPRWSSRQLAVHVASIAPRYTAALQGTSWFDQPPVADSPTDIARHNEAVMERYAGLSDDELVALVRSGVGSYVRAAQRDEQAVFPFHGGVPVSARTVAGVLLGELLVHGWDLARALRRPWPLTAGDVDDMLDGVQELLPHWVDPQRSAAHTATYEIRIRGGRRHLWRFTDGSFTAGGAGPVHCHLSTTPTAFLLTMYGRRSSWWAARTGRALAWGTKPWLAMTLNQRFIPV